MEHFTTEMRLGDVIDDYCVKCRRLTNHSIVSLVDGKAAKVRCRTCYNDHDYRFEQAPPSKKDLKKAELFKEVLGAVAPGSVEVGAEVDPIEIAVLEAAAGEVVDPPEVAAPKAATSLSEPEVVIASNGDKAAAPPAKKTRGRTKRT